MSHLAAERITDSLSTLQGMLAEIRMKHRMLDEKLHRGSFGKELESIQNSTTIIMSELDNINITLDIVENLLKSFKTH